MKELKEVKPVKTLERRDIIFANPLEDVYTASLPIAGAGCIDTHDGLVLIDTLLSNHAANQFKQKIEENVSGEYKYIIYTHGHGDHVGGTAVFLDDNPEIIASKYLPDRFDKYKMLAPHGAHIAAVQFNIPEVVRERNFNYPTKTILGDYTFELGDKTFELHTARAETDDVVWVYIPELKTAFVGDLIIGSFPNIGNPWKPTRFALDWAKTLERIREEEIEYLFCSGAGKYFKGKRAQKALDLNIELIRSLHDQVVEHINKGTHITEMIHKVQIPKHLKRRTYLKEIYSRVEFFVFNVYRWYHGYFDDNPAHLLPRLEKEVKNEIVSLIGNTHKIIERAEELLNIGKPQLAIQVLDYLIQINPKNREALELHMKLLKKLGNMDFCLMSRNAWVYYIEKDKDLLKSLG